MISLKDLIFLVLVIIGIGIVIFEDWRFRKKFKI